MKIKYITIATIALLIALRLVPSLQRYTTNAQNTDITTHYENQGYEQAVQEREALSDQCQGFSFCGEILHNIGNTYFFLGKETIDSEQQKNYRYQALDAYSGSLAIDEDPQTKHNYDEIAKLLGEPTHQDSEQDTESQDGDQQEDGEDGEQGEQESDQQGSEADNQEESNDDQQQQASQGGSDGEQNQEKDGEANQGADQQNQEQPSSLSENQQQQLEQYAQMLEQQQLQNQQFFNKEQQANQNPLDVLFGIPSLRQQINPNSNQKDW